MKKLLLTLAFFALLVPAVAGAQFGSAQPNTTVGPSSPNTSVGASGPNTSVGPSSGSSVFGIKNPLAFDSFCKLANALLNVVMVIGVPVATFFVVWAGFLLVLARGRLDALREARSNLLNTFIGVGIFFGAALLIMILSATLKAFGVDFVSC